MVLPAVATGGSGRRFRPASGQFVPGPGRFVKARWPGGSGRRTVRGRSMTTTHSLSPASGARDDVAIGHLRAFVTVLVIAHHAALAYHPYAPPPFGTLETGPFWRAFPVVDSQHWGGATWLVGFNDTFFMSLMFFLSGLFVWSSLHRKGSAAFLRDRGLRLGLPFAIGATVLAPLAYFPAYLQRTGAPSWSGFWGEWTSLADWPAGPVWFLWLLLAFDAVAAGLFALAPGHGWGDRIARAAAYASRRPVALFVLLVAASTAAYVPMALAFNPMAWTTIGPFAFQTSRLFHYGVYFAIGVGVGAGARAMARSDGEPALFAPDGPLAARWPGWLLAAAVAFALGVWAAVRAMAAGAEIGAWAVASAHAFTVSCAAISFALLALFARFAGRRAAILESLRASAYGMFVVHYALVSWLQYALVDSSLPGAVAAVMGLVLSGALVLSWATSAALRRCPGVARVV